MDGPKVFVASLIVVVVVVGTIAFSGTVSRSAIPFLGGNDSVRPPCDQLQAKTEVDAAVASHPALVETIENVGPGVTVSVEAACDGPPEKAIVHITYASDAERKGVDAMLREEGFGVAAELVHT